MTVTSPTILPPSVSVQGVICGNHKSRHSSATFPEGSGVRSLLVIFPYLKFWKVVMKQYRHYILGSCGIKILSSAVRRKRTSAKSLPAIPFYSANIFNTVFLSLHLQTRIFRIINLIVYYLWANFIIMLEKIVFCLSVRIVFFTNFYLLCFFWIKCVPNSSQDLRTVLSSSVHTLFYSVVVRWDGVSANCGLLRTNFTSSA